MGEICTDVELLSVLHIVRVLIDILKITVPAILVLFIIIDVVKVISSGDADTKKLSKSIGKRAMAAALIFLIPTILNFVLGLFSNNIYYLDCYDKAKSSSEITKIAVEQAEKEIKEANRLCSAGKNYFAYEKARLTVKKIPDKKVRQEYQSELSTLKEKCSSRDTSSQPSTSTSQPSTSSETRKTLWVGDSRVVGICQAEKMCSTGNSCDNDQCIAKVGEDYAWFNNTASGKMEKLFSNKKYTVYINIGVNGVGKEGTNVNKFKTKYIDLAKKYPNQKFVIISVNPVTDGKSNAYNSGVNNFNDAMKKAISEAKLGNLTYCDTANGMKDELVLNNDGLHFSSSVNKKIYNYVIANCK